VRRSGSKNSAVVSTILKAAEANLWAAWEAAQVFDHRVLRGNARESPLGQFLAKRLPLAYGVCSGEAVDHTDSHSTALDIIIYDQIRNGPLAEDPFLMPAESLLAVIEVKTKLTREELRKCFEAARSIRRLKPYKGKFVGARTEGAHAVEGEYRCLYTIFAYTSDLTEEDWLRKEASRVREIAKEKSYTADLIDRIVVLDKGLLSPPRNAGMRAPNSGPSVFHEWFFHLMNYLTRELEERHRPPMDWQAYASRKRVGWESIPPDRDDPSGS
jgi:hypothetical protein